MCFAIEILRSPLAYRFLSSPRLSATAWSTQVDNPHSVYQRARSRIRRSTSRRSFAILGFSLYTKGMGKKGGQRFLIPNAERSIAHSVVCHSFHMREQPLSLTSDNTDKMGKTILRLFNNEKLAEVISRHFVISFCTFWKICVLEILGFGKIEAVLVHYIIFYISLYSCTLLIILLFFFGFCRSFTSVLF